MSTTLRKVVTAASVAALVACGTGGDTAGTGETEGATGGGATEAGAATVTLTDFDIAAPSSVDSGATLTVVNEGDVPHTFTAQEGGDFDTGTIEPGSEATVTVEGSGEVSYVCTIHPDRMQGSFQVGG